MAVAKAESPAQGPAGTGSTPPKTRWLPWPLWLAYALALGIGLALLLTRDRRVETELYDAINKCDASLVLKTEYGSSVPEKDGLNDLYGMVKLPENNTLVSQMFSDCETHPDLARRIFTRALTQGNVSAKLIALHSGFFLAARGALKADDFQLMLDCLAAGNPAEVRTKAQRTISDLTACTQKDAAAQYEAIPAGLSAPSGEEPFKIKTQAAALPDGTEVLGIRWSHPDLALAWLKARLDAGTGAWDQNAKRFIVK